MDDEADAPVAAGPATPRRGSPGCTVSTDAIGAVCDRFHLPPPVALLGSNVLRPEDPDRGSIFAAAFADLVAQGLVSEAGSSPLVAALTLLGSPETLVTGQRQTAVRVDAGFIAVVGADAAEHQPLGPDQHAIAAFPAGEVAARVADFFGLSVPPAGGAGDDPVVGGGAPSVRLSAAELLWLTERVDDGDVAMAEALAAGRDDEVGARGFVAALAARVVAAQVTVTRYTAPGRLDGTSTAWVDGGAAGLWRIPRPTVSPMWEAERADNGDLDGIALVVSRVSAADLLAEVVDGFPELMARPA